MPRKQPNKQITSVTLSPDTIKWLRIYAGANNTSVSAVIEKMAQRFFDPEMKRVLKLAVDGLLNEGAKHRKKDKSRRTDADNT